MFEFRQLGVGAGEPTIEIYCNEKYSAGSAQYAYTPTSNDGVLDDSALVKDVVNSLPVDEPVVVEDYSNEDWPAVVVSVRVRDLDLTMDDEELYERLYPITEVMNGIDIDSYINYD